MLSIYGPWIGFHVFVAVALAVDLGVFHRQAREVRFKEALLTSAVWVALAAIFAGGVWVYQGHEPALAFLTGYVVEWSLSIDNLFVFLSLFSAFATPVHQQHRVLFWGILGALAMRAIFIFAGIALIQKFHWLLYGFGAFLILTGIKLVAVEKREADPRSHWLIQTAKRWLGFTDSYHGSRFFVRSSGRWLGTPLLLVLLIVEATDLVFAADSIPAILSITRDSFIVYTSNVFAILGLRSLYFALAGMMSSFTYLHFGLAGVLVFIGVKMCLAEIFPVPTHYSFLVIVVLLGGAIAASLFRGNRSPART